MNSKQCLGLPTSTPRRTAFIIVEFRLCYTKSFMLYEIVSTVTQKTYFCA